MSWIVVKVAHLILMQLFNGVKPQKQSLNVTKIIKSPKVLIVLEYKNLVPYPKKSITILTNSLGASK